MWVRVYQVDLKDGGGVCMQKEVNIVVSRKCENLTLLDIIK